MSNNTHILVDDVRGDNGSLDDKEEHALRPPDKIEASYARKCTNHVGRKRIDERKEAMLGKKRARQTMFLDLEDVKKSSHPEMSTSGRQRILQPVSSSIAETSDVCRGVHTRLRTSDVDKPGQPILRQGPQSPTNSRSAEAKSSGRKPALVSQDFTGTTSRSKKVVPRKVSNSTNGQCLDTSVQRLIREVTGEKLWRDAEVAELRSVPGQFESVGEYVRLFEPLLFEECRAQLKSTWEELAGGNNGVKVCIKGIERRDRGWYDVVFFPVNDFKLAFKEGDVAVLSTPIPNSGGFAGTIRRHKPVDTRDLPGAVLHFYVGKNDDRNVLQSFLPKSMWRLTTLGPLATVQREYIALHAFSRLNLQMQNAILRPGPHHFPNYELQKPAIPECFTPYFVDHLHRSFNGPQLAAIQWAAMHTSAGTNSGLTKKQDPWPFTLVQGPPGTGKTHTVWGMLNVIHLVQYQHFYVSLLKKLAPESYTQPNDSNSDSVIMGSSIDDVLRCMDQNLSHALQKLCRKPRMLVCAPSNAATDELLSRVLDRGFIDGEMRVYRPDVARVGVDTLTSAAQAVSVERRAELLLGMSCEEVLGHIHKLRGNESLMSKQISWLKNQLNSAAAALHSCAGVAPDVITAREQNRDRLLQNLASSVEIRYKTIVEISRLVIVERKFRSGGNSNLEEIRADLEGSFADEAEIVFTTVSSSGRRLFSRLKNGFDMVVIDEAAQASEVAVLPPLSLGAARCVLVGDPQQLPATVISKAAGTLLYSRSLFERFQQAGCPTILLSIQYRMHPQIRDFPSRYFYQGRLADSETVAKLPDEIYYKDPLLKPYLFFDISHGRESHRGASLSYENVDEARFCVALYMHLQNTLSSLGASKKVSVGIITPYKLQLRYLRQEFGGLLATEEMRNLYINTVDAFQGQERDVIIMSCVRASRNGVGFVADIRRMNVALTRAKRALWVMGNANALMQSEDWASLISDAKNRNCFVGMDSLPRDFALPKTASKNEPSKHFPNSWNLRSTELRK